MIGDKEASEQAHKLVDSISKDADRPDGIRQAIHEIYNCAPEVQKKVAAELISKKNDPKLAKAVDEIVELVVTSNFNNIDKVGAAGNPALIDKRISQADVRAFVNADARKEKIVKETFDEELLRGLDYNPRDDRSHDAFANFWDGNAMTQDQASGIAEKRQSGRQRAQERYDESLQKEKQRREEDSLRDLSERKTLTSHSRQLAEQRKQMVELEKLLKPTNLPKLLFRMDENQDREISRQDIEKTLSYDRMSRNAGNNTTLSDEETQAAEAILKHYDDLKGSNFDSITEESIQDRIDKTLISHVNDRIGDRVHTIDGRDGHSRLFKYDKAGHVTEIYHAHGEERWVYNSQSNKWDITVNGKTTSVAMDVSVDKDGELKWTFTDGRNKGLTRKVTALGEYVPDAREKH